MIIQASYKNIHICRFMGFFFGFYFLETLVEIKLYTPKITRTDKKKNCTK